MLIFNLGCTDQTIKEKKNRDVVKSILSNDTLVYTSFSGHLIIEDLKENRVIKDIELGDVFYYQPILNNKNVFFSKSDSQFVCYSLATNRIEWQLKTENVVKDILLKENNLVLNVKNKGFILVDTQNGNVNKTVPYKYSDECASPDLSPYPMDLFNENLYIANWQCASITKISLDQNKKNSTCQLGEGTAYLKVIGSKIFVGVNENYERGKIFILNASNLKQEFSVDVDYEDRMIPVVWKDKIIYYTFDNAIYLFDPAKLENELLWKLSDSDNLSGSKLILAEDTLMVQTSNFEIISYNIKSKKVVGREKFEDRKLDQIYLKDGKAIKIF